MWRYGFQSRRIAENLGNREMGSWLFWLAPCRYLVHTYDGEIDYYNLRPPLSMWQIVLSCRLFGYNFIGLRFFSALYLVIITAVSMLFVKKAVGTLHLLLCFAASICLYCAITISPKYLVGVGLALSLDFLDKATRMVCLAADVVLACLLLRRSQRFTIREVLAYLIVPALIPTLIWMGLRYSQDGMAFFVKMIEIDVINGCRPQ